MLQVPDYIGEINCLYVDYSDFVASFHNKITNGIYNTKEEVRTL